MSSPLLPSSPLSPLQQIRFCPLASGSKGNAILVETPQTTLLFDAGLSMKNIQQRLKVMGKSLHDIDAIVISHEHQDHIAGIRAITSKYHIPLIANYNTAEAVVETIGVFDNECPKFHIFTTGEPFEWNDVEITPFSVQHDGVDPVAFTLQCNTTKIAICTDLGFATSSVKQYLRDCSLLYIEANHKPEMVQASSRPDSYKKRVLSRIGHLSNEACAELIADIASSPLQHIYLAHLSGECNSEIVAKETISSFLIKYSIDIPLQIARQEIVSIETWL